MLNALVLMFDSVCLRKVFSFINLFLKLHMYVSSSRCNRFLNSKNVMFSSSFFSKKHLQQQATKVFEILKDFKIDENITSKKIVACC
jgi:hypothetical protein